jgi:hypothetical protein
VLFTYWPCLQNLDYELECVSLSLVFEDFKRECALGSVAY